MHKETTNNLNLYVYTVVKDKLEPSGGPLVTPESIQEATKTLKSYINLLTVKRKTYIHLYSCCIPFTANRGSSQPN